MKIVLVLIKVDLQIQGHALVCVTFNIYAWLYSWYRRDPGVYFYIIEFEDHNDDLIKTVKVTVDLYIQGHALFLRDLAYL